jgi:hypothetical protein
MVGLGADNNRTAHDSVDYAETARFPPKLRNVTFSDKMARAWPRIAANQEW